MGLFSAFQTAINSHTVIVSRGFVSSTRRSSSRTDTVTSFNSSTDAVVEVIAEAAAAIGCEGTCGQAGRSSCSTFTVSCCAAASSLPSSTSLSNSSQPAWMSKMISEARDSLPRISVVESSVRASTGEVTVSSATLSSFSSCDVAATSAISSACSDRTFSTGLSTSCEVTPSSGWLG